MTDIGPADWRATLGQANSQGYAYLDFLTAIDRGLGVEVVAHVLNPDSGEHLMFTTHVTSPAGTDVDLVLDSLAPLFRSAEWHEREVAEMKNNVAMANDFSPTTDQLGIHFRH